MGKRAQTFLRGPRNENQTSWVEAMVPDASPDKGGDHRTCFCPGGSCHQMECEPRYWGTGHSRVIHSGLCPRGPWWLLQPRGFQHSKNEKQSVLTPGRPPMSSLESCSSSQEQLSVGFCVFIFFFSFFFLGELSSLWDLSSPNRD